VGYGGGEEEKVNFVGPKHVKKSIEDMVRTSQRETTNHFCILIRLTWCCSFFFSSSWVTHRGSSNQACCSHNVLHGFGFRLHLSLAPPKYWLQATEKLVQSLISSLTSTYGREGYIWSSFFMPHWPMKQNLAVPL
jgi:hypothetical protein